ELLAQIEIILSEPLDFTSTDPDSTHRKVRILTAAATYFNILAIQTFGGRAGAERQAALVEQVVGAAFQTFDDFDPHPEPFDKAAMLLRGITARHPFNDGNKRTGFLTAAYYLAQVGIPEPEGLETGAAPAEAETLCLRISAGQLRDVETIAIELRRLWNQQSPDDLFPA
ncbi:MAG: type II toxin-antitoxin system death-on-curing family toxin, partial [Dehalococcoidia bacterium]